MKAIFVIFIISGFIGVAVFGFLAINHNSGHEYLGCIVVTAKGMNCPPKINSLLSAIFHLDTLKSFSIATFSPNHNYFNSLVLFIFFILLIGSGGAFMVGANPQTLATAKYNYNFAKNHFLPPKQDLAGWLALHENSPTNFKTSA